MKTVINGKTLITKFHYSKHISNSEYDVLVLEDFLTEAKARVESESKGISFVRVKSNAKLLRRGQRITSCTIKVGDVGDKTECEVLVDVSTINRPDEIFMRSIGRKQSFLKALDVLMGSPILLRMSGITDPEVARAQLIDEYNAERKTIEITK